MTTHKVPSRNNILEALIGFISHYICKLLVRTTITPNQITFISGIFGIIGAYLLTLNYYKYTFLAGIFIVLFSIFDGVDGDIARMKNMQSHFGKWLDIFFDRFNDLLIILGLSVGVYFRTNNISALYLGIILMGLVFFIQFSMVMNSVIIRESETINNSGDNNPSRNRIIKNISLLFRIKNLIGNHLLLEHSTFLFSVSLFCLINQTQFGLWFLTFYALLTFIYVMITGGMRILMRSNY